MKRTTILRAMLALALLVLPAIPANAQLSLSFVSSSGNDMATCDTPATACGSIDGALAKTSPGGQIACVDRADYSRSKTTTAILKQISILCHRESKLPPVTIGNGAVVTMRGFSMFADPGPGIQVTNAAALFVQDCNISGEQGPAIAIDPTNPGNVYISDCVINNNAGPGIVFKPASGVQVNFVIENTVLEGNQIGLLADGSSGGIIYGSLRESIVAANNQGVVTQTSGPAEVVVVERVTITNNGVGLFAQDGTAILTRFSILFGNGIGVQANGSAAVFSFADNTDNANMISNGAFTAQVPTK